VARNYLASVCLDFCAGEPQCYVAPDQGRLKMGSLVYNEKDLRDALIRKHGKKLEFLFKEGVDQKLLEFKVESLVGRHFDGTKKGAYVDNGAPNLATAADWALDALREWAGRTIEGNFAELTREWAKNGEGKSYGPNKPSVPTDVPTCLGTTIDWLFLFSRESSNSQTTDMYLVSTLGKDEGGQDLFNLYHWIFTDIWRPLLGGRMNIPLQKAMNKPSKKGLHKKFWDQSDIQFGNSDQTHHFAAYFWWGANVGTSDWVLKKALKHTKDIDETDTCTNPGDVDLGILAAKWGEQMRLHPGYIGEAVERELRRGTVAGHLCGLLLRVREQVPIEPIHDKYQIIPKETPRIPNRKKIP
jgi:hypothetical protein